jgi:glutathione S-transferase
MPATEPPRVYHAASSYYSMIARLALIEAGRPFTPVKLDIHRRMGQFEPDYVRLNPNMTVPTLVIEDGPLSDSRLILFHAFGRHEEQADDATRRLVALQYDFPIDELTFSWLLRWNPLARRFVPGKLAAAERRLRGLADSHPDLADLYRRRADVFAARHHTFDSQAVAALYESRRTAALSRLDSIASELSDGRTVLVPPSYGPADVVWTVFLARMRFIRLHAELARRPAVARYYAAMAERPSFKAADIWPSLNPLKLIRQML